MDKHLLYHHSHQAFYRSPFGAVPVFEKVKLRITGTLLQEARKVELRLWRDSTGEELVPLRPLAPPVDETGAWEVEFTPMETPGLVWYYFIVSLAHDTLYYGNNLERLGGEGMMQRDIPNSWQITVHQQGIQVPEWYLEGVMYQIFPDRFYNGLSNHRVRAPKKNSFLYGHWSDNPLYIRDPATSRILRWDFHGGNLEGIIEKLSYLKELGITILYLNPIFEAASNHRYDTGDYKKIEPMLGTEKTYQHLCREAELLGIRIILDGVFSHTGSDSRYFNREGHYDTQGAYHSKNSPYYPWFRFMEYPEEYDCWWGIDNMPNVNEMEHSFRQYIIHEEDSVIKRWLDKGASGWRLDVADELPTPFIREVRQAMKESDPESVLIGEVWEDASNKVSYGERRSYLLGEELDAVMNYPFRDIMLTFLLGHLTGEEAASRLMSLYENYPREYFYSCMNLAGSHDRARILTLLGEAPDEKVMTLQERTHYSLPDTQRQMAVRRLKLLVAIQMTFPGVPSIYYGDEAGMEGFTDPLNRKTFPWGKEDQEILGWTKQLIWLRNQYPVFRKGEWAVVQAGQHHLAFQRWFREGGRAIVVTNRSPHKSHSFRMSLNTWENTGWWDMITGEDMKTEKKEIAIEMPPTSMRVLAAKMDKIRTW